MSAVEPNKAHRQDTKHIQIDLPHRMLLIAQPNDFVNRIAAYLESDERTVVDKYSHGRLLSEHRELIRDYDLLMISLAEVRKLDEYPDDLESLLGACPLLILLSERESQPDLNYLGAYGFAYMSDGLPEFANALVDVLKVHQESLVAAKEELMNKDILEGKWEEMKGRVRSKWGKLTDDELDQVQGRRGELAGRLQKHYGYTRDEADRAINDFLRDTDKAS